MYIGRETIFPGSETIFSKHHGSARGRGFNRQYQYQRGEPKEHEARAKDAKNESRCSEDKVKLKSAREAVIDEPDTTSHRFVNTTVKDTHRCFQPVRVFFGCGGEGDVWCWWWGSWIRALAYKLWLSLKFVVRHQTAYNLWLSLHQQTSR